MEAGKFLREVEQALSKQYTQSGIDIASTMTSLNEIKNNLEGGHSPTKDLATFVAGASIAGSLLNARAMAMNASLTPTPTGTAFSIVSMKLRTYP